MQPDDDNVIPMHGQGPSETPPPPDGANTAPKGGRGRRKKPDKPLDWGKYGELAEHFALIYGTDTVIDTRSMMIMKINALRLAYGTDYVKMWLQSDQRRTVMPTQIVFSPGGDVPEGGINLFLGMPLEPAEGDYLPLLELIEHLCSESAPDPQGVDAVVRWVLFWLAYPLQHPGAKMASALIFHGGQGTGKNLFFEAIASIYGTYGLVVGQDQLEDRFNDWMSQKLFLIGDEVVARAELYHTKNKLKSLITGETIQINTKMLPLRTEANHVNVVFLSNEQQPLALEQDDRRYLVVYTPPRREEDLYTRVDECLRNGGAAALLRYLLSLDLGDFGRHTRPIMTRAKADLIELGLRPADRFALDWLRGYLPLPRQVCTAEQLYRAFTRWCRETGERFPPPQVTFSKSVAKIARDELVLRQVKLEHPDRGRQVTRIWIPSGCGPPDGVSAGEWARDAQDAFEQALGHFFGRTEGGPP